MKLVLSKREIPPHLLRFFKPQDIIKPKDDMGVPWALARALRRDGWYLRSDIIWSKPNPMPESVCDRPTSAHEHIFLLSKSARYWYDADAVRTPAVAVLTGGPRLNPDRRVTKGIEGKQRGHGRRHDGFNERWDAMTKEDQQATGANLRNVWTIATQAFPDAHFATFPTEIPRRAIKAGTSEHGCCEACGAPWVRQTEKTELRDRRSNPGQPAHLTPQGYLRAGGSRCGVNESITIGWVPSCICDAGVIPCTVLDPFLGSGTTLMVADQLGRHGIGIELNADYALMSERRIRGDAPLFADVEVA